MTKPPLDRDAWHLARASRNGSCHLRYQSDLCANTSLTTSSRRDGTMGGGAGPTRGALKCEHATLDAPRALTLHARDHTTLLQVRVASLRAPSAAGRHASPVGG